jgi:hypothetical protein
MEWTARPEELGADHCMERRLSASSARRGGVRLGRRPGRAWQCRRKLVGTHGPERVSSGGAELQLPLGAVGDFTEKEWGERGGGSRLGDGEARRGKKKGGGSARWRMEEGGSGRGAGREVKAAPARERRCRAGDVHTTRWGERGSCAALASGPPGEWGLAPERERE